MEGQEHSRPSFSEGPTETHDIPPPGQAGYETYDIPPPGPDGYGARDIPPPAYVPEPSLSDTTESADQTMMIHWFRKCAARLDQVHRMRADKTKGGAHSEYAITLREYADVIANSEHLQFTNADQMDYIKRRQPITNGESEEEHFAWFNPHILYPYFAMSSKDEWVNHVVEAVMAKDGTPESPDSPKSPLVRQQGRKQGRKQQNRVRKQDDDDVDV